MEPPQATVRCSTSGAFTVSGWARPGPPWIHCMPSSSLQHSRCPRHRSAPASSSSRTTRVGSTRDGSSTGAPPTGPLSRSGPSPTASTSSDPSSSSRSNLFSRHKVRWYAKRFLHPDIVEAYESILIWVLFNTDLLHIMVVLWLQSTEATEMGHLRDLHEVIKQAKLVLVSSDPTIHSSRNYEKIAKINQGMKLLPSIQCLTGLRSDK
ncbi:hypothetical protein Zm00014a_025117 [Zea mays]|uniref:Uncharacterized protein n=1 Tax=Zea mays TaxID=4577 RepID=A0A3L6D6Y5_MAIZE|nr:hypothetical protein Zm00014a_025117 [Zea mays]